jgi:steroid delta-isomerase
LPGNLAIMVSAERIESVVRRYLELVASGTGDQIAELFADDATVEDPVGGEVHIGRRAITGFYRNIESLPRQTELITLRVAGHEAAFLFAITVGADGGRMRIEPIDVMVFNADGKIASMKAYWSPANVSTG